MRLYAIYTPSHEKLLKDWFLPTLPDKFELHLKRLEIQGGNFRSPDFLAAVKSKIDFVLEAIGENQGDIFIVSDVDIQFFKPVKEELAGLIKDADILALDDGPGGYGCGFMVVRGSKKTLDLFLRVKDLLEKGKKKSEQPAFNAACQSSGVRVKKLPRRYFCPGPGEAAAFRGSFGYRIKKLFGRLDTKIDDYFWQAGMALEIPADICLHHANWTIGVDNKVKQLGEVRKKFKS